MAIRPHPRHRITTCTVTVYRDGDEDTPIVARCTCRPGRAMSPDRLDPPEPGEIEIEDLEIGGHGPMSIAALTDREVREIEEKAGLEAML